MEGFDWWKVLTNKDVDFSPFSHLFVVSSPFGLHSRFLLPCCAWLFIENEPRGARPTCPSELIA